MKSPFKFNLKLSIFGFLAGILNGLFGSSGGIIAVAALKSQKEIDDKKAHATSVCVILPLCIVSVIIYAHGGVFDWDLSWKVCIGALAGGIIGAKLLRLISKKWLGRIFCVMMLAAGIKMLIG